jgi:nudix-type nucleoside diphosphatase (YffH/AdpP family)
VKYEARGKKLIFSEFFRIERCRVRWEQFDGKMGDFQTRYAVRRGDSVGIIPVLETEVVLVRQFRYPAAGKGFDGYLWEIPAGMVREGEDIRATAARELREEIGVETREVKPVLSFYLSPGALDEKFHLFQADLPAGIRIGAVGGNVLEHENLMVKAFPFPVLLSMIEKSEIIDAKTIAALLYFLLRENEGGFNERAEKNR